MNVPPKERKLKSNSSSFSDRVNNGLIIEPRQASALIAGGILVTFLVFISGFFLGQKKALTEFSHKVDQESLADQIYSSLCVLYDVKSEDTNDEQETVASDSIQTLSSEGNQESAPLEVAETSEQEPQPTKHYYAKLSGFGTQKAALAFQKRLSEKDICVEIKKIQSRTKKGRLVTWYQAITPMFTDELAFLGVIERIKAYERIKDIVPIIIGQ
ncbi:hypothetical protein Noda2021_05180 [Candidatus Dependentiae bacterium Noda2021]|nr:hypothetical protein Noda2021_05180 [Candidatus Dependentiae bacterium Noda2021]